MSPEALASTDPAIVVVFVLVAIVVVAFSLLQSGARRRNLESVARKYGGTVTSTWLSETDLELNVDGVPAHLSYHPGSKNRSPFTRILFNATPPGRLRIVVDGFWESLKRAFGSEDLEIGDAAFDQAFVIQGSPLNWVRATLDAETRTRICRLSALGSGFLRGSSVSLEAGPTGVMVAVPRNLVGDGEALESFIGEAIALFRRLRESSEPGVRFLSADQVVKDGRCPVCEHPFGGDVRSCDACATPHHADCWAYFGGCSTYACARRGGR
jgi:hypothetical protein